MRPAFAVLRNVERRETNATITERTGSTVTTTTNHYLILVTKIIVLWVVVWTHETDWT